LTGAAFPVLDTAQGIAVAALASSASLRNGASGLDMSGSSDIDIPGTTLFDGVQARKGYALNKMCFSFNDAVNRQAFVRDEDAYCARYGLNAEQREAVRQRDVLRMIAAGGNVYYLAKLAGIFGLDVQDLGAQQTGLTKDEFKARLIAARG
jgi:protocatechuate 4,5-dioxygenase alpha chain